MPEFYVNADKKAYRLSKVEKELDRYLISCTRYEEHWKNTFGGKQLSGRTHYYCFTVPSVKKLDLRFDGAVYSAKKADRMTVERLVNHLQTLLDLERI